MPVRLFGNVWVTWPKFLHSFWSQRSLT